MGNLLGSVSADAGFNGDKGVLAQLGAVLWPRLAASYIEHHLSTLAPERDDQLKKFQAASRTAQHFESTAASLGQASCPATSSLPWDTDIYAR